MKWYIAQSQSRPEVEDTTTSSVYNYARRGIKESEVEDRDGTKRIVYDYEECRIRKEMWPMFQQMRKQEADIEYLSMITENM